MSYVLGVVCDLIIMVSMIVVFHCFNKLCREKSNLQRDNAIMKNALLKICTEPIYVEKPIEQEESSDTFQTLLGCTLRDVRRLQSMPNNALDAISEEVEH